MSVRRVSLLGVDALLPLFALLVSVVIAWEAVVAPKIAIGAVLALSLVAVAFWRLIAGVALFTVLTFPEHLPGSLGAGLTLAKPVGLVLVASWLLSLASDREGIPFLFRDQPVVAVVALAFFVWAFASVLWAVDIGAVLTNIGRLGQVLLLMFVAYSATRTTRHLRIVLWSYLIGAAIAAIYSLAAGSYSTGGRLAGIFDPNFFAAELVAAMVFGGFMLTAERGPWTRVILLALLALYAVAFVLTESRGGLIALGVSLAVAAALAGPARARVVAVVLVVIAAGVFYYADVAPTRVRERITNISEQGSAGRSDEWKIALQMATDRPLLGVGLGNFQVVEPAYTTGNINVTKVDYALRFQLETHNTYLNLLSELGTLGLGLFVALLAVIVASAVRGARGLARVGDVHGELLARGLISGTIGILVAYIFLSGQYEKQVWLLLGLLAAISAIAHRRVGEDGA